MKTILSILILIVAASLPVVAQQAVTQEPLLDHLTGNWILQGTIAGRETTHDVEAEWVLGHEYVRLHETSREKKAQGQAAYEAIIFIEWDESSNEYRCLWLDSTGGGGLSAQGIAHGKRSGDGIVFLFKDKDSSIHNTFAYSKSSDTWQWLIDNEAGGKVSEFARVKLTRK
ncbi:MAG TPA: hypothetical protein VKH18_14605 [Terriglobales bacterium]|nr:hypothetical protein [Terriglobales bacterium]